LRKPTEEVLRCNEAVDISSKLVCGVRKYNTKWWGDDDDATMW
jgi:hypothetical protein